MSEDEMLDQDWTCHSCGARNGAGSKFCTDCGVERPAQALTPHGRFCPDCGHERSGTTRFCTECGHAFEADEQGEPTAVIPVDEQPTAIVPVAALPVATEPPAAAASGLTPRARQIAIGGAAVVVALIAAVAAFLFFGREGSGDKVAKALAGVATSQAKLDDAVHAATPGRLAPIAPAAKAVLSALAAAETQITAAGDDATVSHAKSAVTAHREYARALSRVRPIARRTRVADFDTAEKARLDAIRAYETLDADADIPLIALGSSLDHVRSRVAAIQAADLRLKTFAVKLDRMLTEAANGRGEISVVIAQTQRCQLAPEDAAARIDSVADNRQSVLNQIASLDPPTPEAQRMLGALQRALTYSREADRQFALWIRNQTAWYYLPPVGCPSGVMPTDEFHSRALGQSSLSTEAKREFVRLYNPLARKYGLRQRLESGI